MEAGPDYVQDLVADARRAGRIREDWVEDARAPDPLLPDVWASPAEFAAAVARQVRDWQLDRQDGQPTFVELWCEAGDLMARLERVAGELSVPVYSGGGFDGLKAKRHTADRILRRWRERRQRTVVLEVSDLDLHGLSMVRARDEDIAAWVGDDAAGLVTFERIALTEAQARDHDLLDADGKAEVDGLPVPVMDGIVRDAIDRHHVPARREQVERDERDARDRLPDAIRVVLDGDPGA